MQMEEVAVKKNNALDVGGEQWAHWQWHWNQTTIEAMYEYTCHRYCRHFARPVYFQMGALGGVLQMMCLHAHTHVQQNAGGMYMRRSAAS